MLLLLIIGGRSYGECFGFVRIRLCSFMVFDIFGVVLVWLGLETAFIDERFKDFCVSFDGDFLLIVITSATAMPC